MVTKRGKPLIKAGLIKVNPNKKKIRIKKNEKKIEDVDYLYFYMFKDSVEVTNKDFEEVI